MGLFYIISKTFPFELSDVFSNRKIQEMVNSREIDFDEDEEPT
jgi:hypothetical protein